MNPRCYVSDKRYDEKYDKKYDEKKCKKCEEEPGKVLLKCNNGFSVNNLVSIALPGGGFEPVPLGSVSIDTDKLCNPTVLLTVSGRISTLVTLETGTGMSIRVTKICKGISQVISNLNLTNVASLLLSDSFSFQVCDSNSCTCDECATYNVEFVPASPIAIGVGMAITNVVISALAVEKMC